MKPSLIDTDILSLFFRGHAEVANHFAQYISAYNVINFSLITYYEIVSGLKHRDANKQLDLFLEFAAQNHIAPLTPYSVTLSANLYAQTRVKGTPVDDVDLLIAGVAMANNWALVTHNTRHFARISGLELVDWTKSVVE